MAFEGGRVDDFVIDASYAGSDPFDAHVHAATIACGAAYLVTFDVNDFVSHGKATPYEVLHPDDFLCLVDDACPDAVSSSAITIARYWFRRTSEADLVPRLKHAGCPRFAERVRRHLLREADQLRD